MARLRVLQVVPELDSQAGSVAILVQALRAALEARGIQAPLLFGRSGAPLSDVSPASGTRFSPQAAEGLIAQADLVHLHGWDDRLMPAVQELARRARKPVVLTPAGFFTQGKYSEGSWWRRLLRQYRQNRLLKTATAVLALNAEEECLLQARRPQAKVRMLPYGLSFSDYETPAPPPPIAVSGPYVLVLGPIHPVEGLVPVLKALAELGNRFDAWRLVLAGPEAGPWRRMLEAAIRRKGAAERVLFATADDVVTQRAWLAGAELLVVPSLVPRAPVALLQGLAAGVPVLASCLVVPPGLESHVHACPPRRSAFKETLDRLLALPGGERAELGRQARERARALFDWPVLADNYADCYQRAMQERDGPPTAHA